MNEQSDILISRVVDGVASSGDWADLERAAGAQPGLWRELALAQRDQALLAHAVGEAIAPADRFDLPRTIPTRYESVSPSAQWKRFGVWGGWAAAAAVALAYVGVGPRGAQQASLVPDIVDLGAKLTADQAWDVYEAAGKREQRLLGELPERVLIQATPSADGKTMHLVFVRQIIEGKTVTELLKPTWDEAGQPAAVPVQFENLPVVQPPEPAPQAKPRRQYLPAVRLWRNRGILPDNSGHTPAGTVPASTETMS